MTQAQAVISSNRLLVQYQLHVALCHDRKTDCFPNRGCIAFSEIHLLLSFNLTNIKYYFIFGQKHYKYLIYTSFIAFFTSSPEKHREITRQRNPKPNAKFCIYLAKKRKKQYLCGVNLNHIQYDCKRSF